MQVLFLQIIYIRILFYIQFLVYLNSLFYYFH